MKTIHTQLAMFTLAAIAFLLRRRPAPPVPHRLVEIERATLVRDEQPWCPKLTAATRSRSFAGYVKRLVAATTREWMDDNVMRLSASLSFYTMFSLSPLLVLVLLVCGHVFGEEAVRGQLDNELQHIMGTKAAAAVQGMVVSATDKDASLLATLGGLVVLLLGATGLFGEIKAALNTIWEAGPRKERALWDWSRTRISSLGMVAGIMFLLMASLIFSTLLAFASEHFSGSFNIPPAVWWLVGFLTGLIMETVLFALLFRVLPDVRLPMRDIWIGAFTTAVLFEIGKWALGWYLGRETISSAYGAAGSLMLVLLWVYYTSVIVLTGAEITQVNAKLRGARASRTANGISE